MADRIEVHDGSFLVEQAPGPDGPTYFVRLGDERITPRAAGDLLIDRNVQSIDWETGWIYPTLTNGWVNYGGTYHPARYRKALGVVTIEGLVKSGTINTAVLTTAAGYRPEYRILTSTLSAANTTQRRLDVTAGGALVAATGSNGWYELYVTFWAGF